MRPASYEKRARIKEVRRADLVLEVDVGAHRDKQPGSLELIFVTSPVQRRIAVLDRSQI